jgi:outer membrane protein TolC
MRAHSEKARAEADVAAAEVRLIRAKLELEQARVRVGYAMGAVGESYEPTEQPMALGPVPSERDSIKIALEHRPELRALDFHREGLKQNLRSVKARRYPTIDALLGVNSRGQFLPAADQDGYQRFNWNAGIVVSIPIFQGLLIRKQNEELSAEISAVDGGQEAIRQAVILEVKQALAAVRAADAAGQASQKGVAAAAEALETLKERYAEGLARLVEVTDVQAAYLSARSQVVQATYDRYAARAALSLAMGRQGGL